MQRGNNIIPAMTSIVVVVMIKSASVLSYVFQIMLTIRIFQHDPTQPGARHDVKAKATAKVSLSRRYMRCMFN